MPAVLAVPLIITIVAISRFTYIQLSTLFQCYDVHLCLYKAEKPSVCLSDHHDDTSTISVSIERGCAHNESRVFWDHKVYFTSLNVPVSIHMSAQKALV